MIGAFFLIMGIALFIAFIFKHIFSIIFFIVGAILVIKFIYFVIYEYITGAHKLQRKYFKIMLFGDTDKLSPEEKRQYNRYIAAKFVVKVDYFSDEYVVNLHKAMLYEQKLKDGTAKRYKTRVF